MCKKIVQKKVNKMNTYIAQNLGYNPFQIEDPPTKSA